MDRGLYPGVLLTALDEWQFSRSTCCFRSPRNELIHLLVFLLRLKNQAYRVVEHAGLCRTQNEVEQDDVNLSSF